MSLEHSCHKRAQILPGGAGHRLVTRGRARSVHVGRTGCLKHSRKVSGPDWIEEEREGDCGQWALDTVQLDAWAIWNTRAIEDTDHPG